MTELTQPKKRGGDTRLAAEKNGKKVGSPAKAGTRFPRRLLVPLHDDDDDSLAAFARVDTEAAGETITKQDLVRLAISRYLIDRRIL